MPELPSAHTFELSFRAQRGICFLLVLGAFVCPYSQGQVQRPRILGISHVRIRVSDFCKAQDFYFKTFGQRPYCPVDQRPEPEGGSVALWSSQEITLNVNSFYAPTSPNRSSLLEEVGFLTDDAAGLRQYLKSRSIPIDLDEVDSQPPRFLVHDPEGHRIEFVERIVTPSQDPPLSQIQSHIIHAGFVVRDRAAMDSFYKDILGFHIYWHGGMTDEQTNWVDMQVPDGTDWLEYMLNVAPDASHKTLGVMNHIALGVSDIHEAQRQLIKNGWKGTEQPKIGRDGKWQLNLYDPDDTRIELMEFTPTKKPCCSDYSGPHPKP
jgi:catechol 2,3-dioxygenase-like lactoylglutathione lyase family enzyme